MKVLGIKKVFTNAVDLTKATIYRSASSCYCRIVSRSSLSQIDRSKRNAEKYFLTASRWQKISKGSANRRTNADEVW